MTEQEGIEVTEQPPPLDPALEKILDQVRAWLQVRDPKPRSLTLKHAVGMTQQGPAHIFQLYSEEIVCQVTEVAEQPRIVPAGVVPPNGAPPR